MYSSQTIRRNKWEKRVHLYKNAVWTDNRFVSLQLNTVSPSSSGVDNKYPAQSIEEGALVLGSLSEDGHESVAAGQLDALFDGAPERPSHPFLSRAVSATDVAAVVIDSVSNNLAALWGLRALVETGLPPLIVMSLHTANWEGCDSAAMLRWLYGLGYRAYVVGLKRALTLEDWDALLPMLSAAKFQAINDELGIPMWTSKLLAVHESAPVPAVIGLDLT
jgi:hypothetical protein